MMYAGDLHAQYYFNMFRPQADTIYAKLQHTSEKDKIDIYNSLAFYHSFANADSAIYYAELALELENTYPDEIRRADANRHMGNAYALNNQYGRALFHLNQAINIYEDHRSLRKKAELLFDIGKVNYDLQDYQEALNYMQRFEQLYEQENNEKNIIATPLEYAVAIGAGGGSISHWIGDYELSKNYFHRYIALSRMYDFPSLITAMVITSLGETSRYNGEYDSALHYYYQGRAYYPHNQDKPFELHTGYEGEIGYLLFRVGKPHVAIPLIRTALNENMADKNYYYSTFQATRLGNVFLHLKVYDSALYYYQQSLLYSEMFFEKHLGSMLDTLKPTVFFNYQNLMMMPDMQIRQRYYARRAEAYDNLYQYYQQRNDSKKALEYLQYKLPYLDSVRITAKETDLYRIQARFENERLEQQVNNLTRDNELAAFKLQRNKLVLASVGVIFLLVVALGVFYFRQSRINAMHEKLLVQQRLFRSQMNPHFIFNSLSIVQNFIVKHDDAKASIYLSRFSELVRSILNNSSEEQITLEEELATIGNYLALQKVRFSDQFDYELVVDDSLDPESTFIPPMLAQPFIENAIEHGVRNLGSKGKVDVRFIRGDDKISLEIEDNGIGREMALEFLKQRDKTHKSMATAITRERIAILNRKLKRKITMEIIDMKDEHGQAKGTKVVFGVPV
ncbi:MAG: histidine kinase [Lentimicrobium sp.]|nr:histidine kinase [Lentimicrobium sp.]